MVDPGGIQHWDYSQHPGADDGVQCFHSYTVRSIAISISGIMVSFGFSIAPGMLDLGIQSVGWRGTWF